MGTSGSCTCIAILFIFVVKYLMVFTDKSDTMCWQLSPISHLSVNPDLLL